jgi:hypothetical protein
VTMHRWWNFVVRGESWLTMCCATSSLPLFFRYVVTPVAQKVGLPIGAFDASVARAALNHSGRRAATWPASAPVFPADM